MTANAKSPPFDPDRDGGQLPALLPGPEFQFGLRTLFVVVLVVAVCCTAVLLYRQLFSFDESPIPIDDQSKWPRPLQQLIADAREQGIELGKIRVTRSPRSMFNEDYAWRMDASPELIEQLVSRWKLVQDAGPTQLIDEFWRVVPENWRRQQVSAARSYWISQTWLDRHGDDRYVVLHERDSRKLCVWYHFHF